MTLNGVTKTMREWCDELNLNYSMVQWRKTEGKWSDEECLKPTGTRRIKLEYQGKVYTPNEIAKIVGIKPACVYLRIARGWPVEEIINRPNSQPYKKPGWSYKAQ